MRMAIDPVFLSVNTCVHGLLARACLGYIFINRPERDC